MAVGIYTDKKSRISELTRLSFVLLALAKTAATYSPTVTQYHRRDWA